MNTPVKQINLFFATLLILLAFASCKKSGSDVKPEPGGIDLKLDAVNLQQASADNTFTFNLLKTVNSANTESSNLFISPLSVSMALAMTANGANGQTLKSIDSTLNFSAFTQDQINSYYNKLLTQLPQLDPNTTLKIANSIWYDNKFTVLPLFKQTDSSYYQAVVQPLDFSAKASVGTINNWVSNQTNGKITQLLTIIPPGEVMYLINAIYFKSTWLNKFDPAQTQKMNFYLSDNSTVQADFMQGRINFNRYANNNVSVAELPYSNSKYSMVIVMPAAGKSITDIVSTLDNNTWQSWISGLNPETESLSMPKFQYSYDITLNGSLKAMGMGIAFSDFADFSRINSSIKLEITDVKHKAFIAVDEAGTEAAAATSVGIGTTAASPVIINRPFIFVIREMKTGLILFTGTVSNPVQSGL